MFKEVQNSKLFWPVIQVFAVLLFVFVILSPYVQTEINTYFGLSKIDGVDDICKSRANSPLESIKVLSMDLSRGRAKIYCLYQEKKDNIRINLEKVEGRWQVIFVEKLNTEGNFYWPVYF